MAERRGGSGAGAGRPAIRGRGTALNPEGRFEDRTRGDVDDGWAAEDESPSPRTELYVEHARSIISRNASPDLPFDQSLNPYRGCEHGCVYCYARPAHAYMDLSPGLDFETKLFYKPDAAVLLERELRNPRYRPRLISLGANTDPYQPVERQLQITRQILEVLARFRHPVVIVTKGAAMIRRDIDLLTDLARDDLVEVAVSVTTLDPELKRRLEPRAASPGLRLKVLEQLAAAGVPTRVMFSPVIPFINDAELEQVLEAAAGVGVRSASYIMLRLPYEVKALFADWLQVHYPLKAEHVMSLVRQMRGGADNDSRFGRRMRGQGQYAELIAQRFRLACRRLGLNRGSGPALSVDRFRVPEPDGPQLALGL